MDLPFVLKSVLANYWNLDGRMSRTAYWQWMAFAGVSLLGVTVVSSAVFSATEPANADLGWLGIAAISAVLIPMVAATARRMQDAGFSSWLFLLALLVPVLGWAFVLGVVIRPGDPRANKYGPVPAIQ